ncbi:DNA-binding protein [archaeon]|nr:MAG: DNA-binding protein [archaeon]
MRRETKNWLDSAQYDLETAEHMLTTGRYIYTIFMCHLALEKVLKAKVQEVTNKTPPRTHNLRYLVRLSGIELPEEKLLFISKLSDISVPTRYPEDFDNLIQSYTREVADEYLKKTKEIFEWMKNSFKS